MKKLSKSELVAVSGAVKCHCITGNHRAFEHHYQLRDTGQFPHNWKTFAKILEFDMDSKTKCTNKCCEELGMQYWDYGDVKGKC